MVQETSLQNLKKPHEWTQEERAITAKKVVLTKKERKAKRERFAMGANFAIDVLSTKKTVKKDGKQKKMLVYDMAIERLIEIIMDKEHPRFSLQALELLHNLTQGDPKLYQQININMNQIESAEIGNDIESEYQKLIGHKFEQKAEVVEAEVIE